MGRLLQIEPATDTTKATYVFSDRVPTGSRGFSRRDNDYTIGAIDYGFSPFGDLASPIDMLEYTWGGRILTHGRPDFEYDKLATAVGQEEPVLLVYKHDDGWIRVVHAQFKSLEWPRHTDDDRVVDAKVTWKILEPWRERAPANQIVAGASTPILANNPGGLDDILSGNGETPITTASGVFLLPDGFANSSVAGSGGIANVADNGPVIRAVGPIGGDFGWISYNTSVVLYDRNGVPFNPAIGATIFVPPGAYCEIDCGAEMITQQGIGDITNLVYKASDDQPYWMSIKEGIINKIGLSMNGPNGINYYQPVSMIPNGSGFYPSSGSFQLQVTPPGHSVQTTAGMNFNDPPSAIRTNLELMGGLGIGQVRVTAFLNPLDGLYYNANGHPGYNVMFIGTQAGVTIPTMTSVNTFNRGTISIATVNGSLLLRWNRYFR